MSAPTAKEQIGRLELLLDRVRSRARNGSAHAGAKLETKAESPSTSDLAVPVTSPKATPPAAAAPIAPLASKRPSVAPPLPPQALGHAGAAAPIAPPPSSAVPSTMEIGADDMIESVSPVQPAAARAPSEMPPSAASAPLDSAGDAIDVDVTEDEVEHPAPSSARRPKSERAHALASETSEEPRRPQTMPPESGRQIAANASPSVPAESGKRASVPAAAFDAHAEAAQTHQIASGRAKSTNPAAFIGAPRRAASTFGEMLDDALSI